MAAKLGWCVVGDVLIAAVYSGMRLAEEAGLDLTRFAEYIEAAHEATPLLSTMLARPTTRPMTLEDGPEQLSWIRSRAEIVQKDLANALDFARSLGFDLPVVESTRSEVGHMLRVPQHGP